MEERRDSVRRHAAALIAVAALCGAAQGCELPAGTRIESAKYALSFRTEPARLEVGSHFAVLYGVCPKAGAAQPARMGVDAWMPEHRHGMNYKASVTALGGGGFRAEGLLLHMPGRWELLFDLDGERLRYALRVE